MRKIYVYLLFLLSSFFGCYHIQSPVIEDGVLDVKNINFDEAIIRLNGDWKFYWMQTPEDIKIEKERNSVLTYVPSRWEKNLFFPEKTRGYGTYQLKIKNNSSKENLSLYISSIWCAYEVYLNQERIFSMGKTSIDKENFIPEVHPYRLNFPKKLENFELEILVYDPLVGVGGIEKSLLLSSTKNIKNYNTSLDYEYTIFIGMIFMMGIFYFTYYFLNLENPSFLYFGAFTFVIGTRELLIGQKILVQLLNIPFSLSHRLDFICKFLAVFFFTRFIKIVFPHEISSKLDKTIFYTTLGVSCLVLFVEFPLLYWLDILFRITFVGLGIYFCIKIFTAYRNEREDSGIYVFALTVICIVSINDVMHSFKLLNTGYYLVYAYLFFLFLQSFLISKKNSKSYKELRIMGTKLRKIGKVKDDFMSNLSHEMRTPLSLIYAFSELLLDNPKADPEIIEAYSRDIHREAKSLIEIINDLMMVTDLETKFSMRIKANSINEMMKEAIDYLEGYRDERKVKINIDGDSETFMYCDRSLMIKVLIIIIKNAIIYNHNEGWINISWHLEVDQKVHITVSDNGYGIPSRDIPNIFDKFFRVDNSITYKVSGVGVGLFIAKRIIELHEGEIYVESEIDTGSRFHILISS